jgi:hypothetical protein
MHNAVWDYKEDVKSNKGCERFETRMKIKGKKVKREKSGVRRGNERSGATCKEK